ncbi:hypothetical protein D3C86_2192490 [compost metagenome]
MKSWGQKVAPKMKNLRSGRFHQTAWWPPQFSQTVPKYSRNSPAPPIIRRLRNRPVKARV